MTPPNQLDLFIDDYFKETDKKTIQNISLVIPEHNGHFWIINSESLSLDLETLTFNPAASFSLAIYFSFDNKSRKGSYLADKIARSECFKDFTVRTDSRRVEYFKDKYIDKVEIIEKVKAIALCIFPKLDFNDIIIKLNRLDNWMTIEGQDSI